MILGILQADSVNEQFQGEFGDYPSMVVDLLNGKKEGGQGNTIEFSTYNDGNATGVTGRREIFRRG